MEMKKLKKWSWSSFFLAILVAVLALFIAHEAKKEKMTYMTAPAKGRHPASIQKIYDFSQLQGSTLDQAAKQRLLTGLNIERTQEANNIQLGNFVLLNSQQQKDFVCGVYNHITLSFQAEGVAVSGEKPTLVIDTPCGVADNINSLAPIRVPFQQIKTQSPRTHELVLQQDGGPLHILSDNNPESWPKNWALTEIKMTHDQDPSKVLQISPADIKDFANKPVFMKW
jgi:hypothetical protein